MVGEAVAVTVRNDQSGPVDLPRWTVEQDAALDEAIGRATDGIPTLLLVDGAPGTGKTAFLRRVAASARDFTG